MSDDNDCGGLIVELVIQCLCQFLCMCCIDSCCNNNDERSRNTHNTANNYTPNSAVVTQPLNSNQYPNYPPNQVQSYPTSPLQGYPPYQAQGYQPIQAQGYPPSQLQGYPPSPIPTPSAPPEAPPVNAAVSGGGASNYGAPPPSYAEAVGDPPRQADSTNSEYIKQKL